MAAKKKVRKPKVASASQRAAIQKSIKAIRTANRNLELLLKKHQQMVSPMYFAL
jgi:hypothetical protein